MGDYCVVDCELSLAASLLLQLRPYLGTGSGQSRESAASQPVSASLSSRFRSLVS